MAQEKSSEWQQIEDAAGEAAQALRSIATEAKALKTFWPP